MLRFRFIVYHLLAALFIGLGFKFNLLYAVIAPVFFWLAINSRSRSVQTRKAISILNKTLEDILADDSLTNENADRVIQLLHDANRRISNGQDPLESASRLRKEALEYLEIKNNPGLV